MKISEVLRLLQADGWQLVATRGSHRQFKHKDKLGRVTVPGKPSDDDGKITFNLKSSEEKQYRINASYSGQQLPQTIVVTFRN